MPLGERKSGSDMGKSSYRVCIREESVADGRRSGKAPGLLLNMYMGIAKAKVTFYSPSRPQSDIAGTINIGAYAKVERSLR